MFKIVVIEENRGIEFIVDILITNNTINSLPEGGVNTDVKAREMAQEYDLTILVKTANYVGKRLQNVDANTFEYAEMLESKTFKKAYGVLEEFLAKVDTLKRMKIEQEKDRKQKVRHFLEVRLSKLLNTSKLTKASRVITEECLKIKTELRTLGDVDGIAYRQVLSNEVKTNPNSEILIDVLNRV